MNLDLDPADLQPIIAATVAETIDRLEADRARLNGRLAYREAEAAALLGIPAHSLRDARRRGEIVASLVGKRILYSRTELLAFLQRRRVSP